MSDDVDLVATRRSLHAVAEHVLAAARYQATGRIGLVVSTGGFATPPFDGPAGETVVAVAGTDLVVRDGRGPRRAPLTTVAAAAELVGVDPGAPTEVYPPETPLRPEEPLALDPAAVAVLAGALRQGGDALDRLVADVAAATGEEPATVTLWPEHFDVATTLDEVNYGVSPGDDDHPRPYAYVGPWTARAGAFWDAPFGAAHPLDDLADAEAVAAFFAEGRHRAAEDPPA